MYSLKVPNQIFSLGLSPNELKVYLYLCRCKNRLGAATVRVSTIQAQCAISSDHTVRRALAALEQNALITKTMRHGRDGQYISCLYTVASLGGRWFRLWLPGNPFMLDKSAFAVYLYLCRQQMRSGKACPSQQTIAKALGMARHTVIDAIHRLVKVGMVVKSALWAGKHNLYTVLQNRMRVSNKKEMPPKELAATSSGHPSGLSTFFNIPRLIASVKDFFRKTCAKTAQQYIDLTLTPKKERNFISLTYLPWNRGTSAPFPTRSMPKFRSKKKPWRFLFWVRSMR